MSSRPGHLAAHPREDLDHVEDPLDRPEVGDVDQQALPGLGPAAGPRAAPRLLVARRIDEVGDHVDLRSGCRAARRSCRRSDSETAVTASLCDDPPAGRLQVVRVVAHQGHVRAVERGHHRQRLGRHDLRGPARPRPRSAWRSGRAARRACWWRATSTILVASASEYGGYCRTADRRRHHLVEEDPRVEQRQARRQGVADDVDLVAAARPAPWPARSPRSPSRRRSDSS